MSNQQVKLSGLQDRLEFIAMTKLICKNQIVTPNISKPQKRYGHLSFIYKSKLYVIGGCQTDSKNKSSFAQGNKGAIYCYSLEKQRSLVVQNKKGKKLPEQDDARWQRLEAKFTPQAEGQFQLLSYSAHCIFPHKKRLYIFGGSTFQGRTSSHLFRLDLDSLQWSKPEQKGTVPKAREQAFLSLYTKNQKHYLVLYGGANYETYDIHTDINFYQIQTKFWFQCHNLSINFIQPRISPGVCFNDNKIYLFGGYYIDAQDNKGYLNDLYQIQFDLTLQKGRPYGRSFAKRLDQSNYSYHDKIDGKPEKRCSSQLVFYKPEFEKSTITTHSKKQGIIENNYLLLIGGQKSCDYKKKVIDTLNDMWIFSLQQLQWINVTCIHEFRSRSSFSTVIDQEINKIFVFGGLSSQEVILNDLISIKINEKFTEIHDLENKIENKVNENIYEQLSIQSNLVDEVCDTITFPYSAIGLIIDNFVNFQAKFCDITYHISKSKNLAHNYIKFESNAHFGMSHQIMFSHFACLKGGIRTYVQGTDKKIKAEMNRDNLFKEVGTNFVIGGLRLGNQIVFINLSPETFEIEIIIVLKYNNASENGKQNTFQCKTTCNLFSFIIRREQIFSEDVFSYERNTDQANKRRQFFQNICPQESRQRIRALSLQGINSIRKGEVKNILYISKLKTVDGQQCSSSTTESQLQLFPDMMKNDIVYGNRELIREIELSKIPIYQCMDISLHTYISYLYTQHCQTEINLSIQGLQRRRIPLQDFLLKFDDLLKNKDIIEISNEFEFDCKIIELYYLANKLERNPFSAGKNDTKFFGHGTLYYHKNRLIKRQGINLGDYLFEYNLRSIRQTNINIKSTILKSSNCYSAVEIFGHIEVPQAVPVNITKTDFVFPVMLEKIDQKLRLMEDQVIKQKYKGIKQKSHAL